MTKTPLYISAMMGAWDLLVHAMRPSQVTVNFRQLAPVIWKSRLPASEVLLAASKPMSKVQRWTKYFQTWNKGTTVQHALGPSDW